LNEKQLQIFLLPKFIGLVFFAVVFCRRESRKNMKTEKIRFQEEK